MKLSAVLLACLLGGCMLSCTRLVPVSDTTTTRQTTDTTRTPITVNIPASTVTVSLNMDSLLSAAKGKNQIIYLKGESGRSSFGLSVKPTGIATVECHCADSTLKVMQLLVTKLIEKDRVVVQEEKPTAFGKFISDAQDNLFWILVAGGVVLFFVLRK